MEIACAAVPSGEGGDVRSRGRWLTDDLRRSNGRHNTLLLLEVDQVVGTRYTASQVATLRQRQF